MRSRAMLGASSYVILALVLAALAPARAAVPDQAVLADFESGVDGRGRLVGNIGKSGPHYGWENPPSPAGDDINYFDVTSDGDGRDEYVDYMLAFPEDDWNRYSQLIVDGWMWSDGGGSGKRIRVYAHDAGGVGNSDGNGYHNLGTTTATGTFSLEGMSHRSRVDHILIRVHESDFGGVHKAGARQRTHLRSIRLRRKTEFPGLSLLEEATCLKNSNVEVCFDDLFGGTVSSIYNRRTAPDRNFVLPTMGGAFQFALRSADPITACPQKAINWGAVWNPTQAGCEECYTDGSKWFHVASEVWDRFATATTHHIEIQPRNYFHHDRGDCRAPLPYTGAGAQEELIGATQDAELFDDYVRIDWTFENQGTQTHSAVRQGLYRHELPSFYMAPFGRCPRVVYEDIDGVVRDIAPPCQDGGMRVFDLHRPGRSEKGFRAAWYTVYDPAAPTQAVTVFARTDLADISRSGAALRNYDEGFGLQIDLSQYFALAPGQSAETSVFILPYRWDEVMSDGTRVLDFIHAEQAADVQGARTSSDCNHIAGWARDPGDNQSIGSVRLLLDGLVLGDVVANRWVSGVGYRGFRFDRAFGAGTHLVEVLARDIETGNYRSVVRYTQICY